MSKYTTASERCVRLAGWLAGLSAVLTSLQYLLRFASLCFALLRLLASHSTCFAASKNKNQNQIQNQNQKQTIKVLLLLLLFLHYDYSRKFRADLWVHESPWIGSNSQTNNKQVAPNKQSIALSLV